MSNTSTPRYALGDFEPLLGQPFEIGSASTRVQATLVEASNLREAQGAGLRSQQFSLVWRGPAQAVLPQQIYTVTHPLLGSMELFLVPVGADAEGTRYEAVFT